MSLSKVKRLLAYFGMPAAFCVTGYLVLWLALQPVWSVAMATMAFLVADDAPQFDSNLRCVYDPDAYKPEEQVAVEEPSNVIDGKDVAFPLSGEQYGQLECARIGLDAPVYWYDEDDILMFGVGQSLISMPPGFGYPIILSGHNTTFFNCLQNIAEGDVVTFHTNYCDYDYRVTRVEIHDEVELESYLLNKACQEREELVMYTCYPFQTVVEGRFDRFVVLADRIAGKDVIWKESLA